MITEKVEKFISAVAKRNFQYTDAEDFIQDVYVRLLIIAKKYENKSIVEKERIAMKTAVNLMNDIKRTAANRRRILQGITVDRINPSNPVSDAIHNEIIDRMMKQLSELEKRVFNERVNPSRDIVKFCTKNYSPYGANTQVVDGSAIARKLNVSKATVSRAMNRIKHIYHEANEN